MKMQLALLTTAMWIMGSAAVIVNPRALYQRCIHAGDKTLVSVLYKDNTIVDYTYGECVPGEIKGHPVVEAVFCRDATCHGYKTDDCSGAPFPPTAIPIHAPPPAGFPVAGPNFKHFEKAGKCHKNGTPGN